MFKQFLFKNQLLLNQTFPNCDIKYCLEMEFNAVLELNNGNLEKSIEDIKEFYLDVHQIELV